MFLTAFFFVVEILPGAFMSTARVLVNLAD